MWKRRRKPAPEQFGNLTVWETVGECGEEYISFAEVSTDPRLADTVEHLKQVMREQGWSQTAGD